MNKLVIGAPFGNYIQPKNATATLGTFTLKPRPGRWMQVAKTVRPIFFLGGAWVNKIGLRNPGINSILNAKDLGGKIVSIHGFNEEEWFDLVTDRLPRLCSHPEAIEMNWSCPNVQDAKMDRGRIFREAVKAHNDGEAFKFIVKLPPIFWEEIFQSAYDAGIRMFHCCNTLPVSTGGMSGKPVKKYSLEVIKSIRWKVGEEAYIIGGGGVTSKADIDDYANAGVDAVSIASGLFNPYRAFVSVHGLADYANFIFKKSLSTV